MILVCELTQNEYFEEQTMTILVILIIFLQTQLSNFLVKIEQCSGNFKGKIMCVSLEKVYNISIGIKVHNKKK